MEEATPIQASLLAATSADSSGKVLCKRFWGQRYDHKLVTFGIYFMCFGVTKNLLPYRAKVSGGVCSQPVLPTVGNEHTVVSANYEWSYDELANASVMVYNGVLAATPCIKSLQLRFEKLWERVCSC
jgi:hypothetical protein